MTLSLVKKKEVEEEEKEKKWTTRITSRSLSSAFFHFKCQKGSRAHVQLISLESESRAPW